MRLSIFFVMLLALTGCSGSATLSIRSDTAIIQPTVRTAVYRFVDQNTADVYLSDFPPNTIVDRLTAIEGEPGTIVHIHVFLAPQAGKTPIDFTASNAALKCIVLSGRSMGVYGGGGFVLPASTLGDISFGARVREATVRLVSSREGFADRLGNGWVEGNIEARRDDELAGEISSGLTRLLLR
ncbi:MAG: hypothetical protein JNK58_03960 [Phycisphaerae bacterium]|nr:hypothetical protein [Phycisphaerae bacterium]